MVSDYIFIELVEAVRGIKAELQEIHRVLRELEMRN